MSDDLNAVLGASGGCPEVAWNGKTWKIGHPVGRAKTILTQIIIANASAEITGLEGVIPPAATARMFKELTNNIGARYYHTWHPGWLEAVGSQDGDVLFLLSLLRLHHPEATEADARGMSADVPGPVAVAMAQVTPPFFDLLEADFPQRLADQKKELVGQIREVFVSRYQSPPSASV